MSFNTGKGKERAIDLTQEEEEISSSAPSSSESESSDDFGSESEDEITQERLDSLLKKAMQNAEEVDRLLQTRAEEGAQEEEVITLADETLVPIPSLDPGNLPAPYIVLGATRFDGPSVIRDPEVERTEKATALTSVPAPPILPEELTKSGKPLTKKEKKVLRAKTAGKDWFDLPAPPEYELPRMYREVEALRLRNQLDPKRFYKKDEGEGKGIKGLPKYFAIGTILPTKTPFGTPSSDNLTRANRKRTLVDELVDDAEAKRYAKKKFEDLQTTRGAKGRNTLRAKQRKAKW
ncbi:Fcf2-domain-containing protein [Pholiota conissans]|uniref:Fcf2-domain-containing protein n=1 Tax=Pholiota conissans TaxID=109636 RepID=A0A9P6D2K1_9AGAR|nr:Fcf2-domain-containing protein [Pholiota conissans]